MKRLVFLVEGEGDALAVPSLAGRLLTQLPDELQPQLFVDDRPFRIGELSAFTGRRQTEWLRYLRLAAMRLKGGGAILAVFDGDCERLEGQPFCAVNAARLLAERGVQAGAGHVYSLAIVLLRQEYESILIAAGNQISGYPDNIAFPPAIEETPRDAKGWLGDHLPEGYDPVRDQRRLTQAVQDWVSVRNAHRSFRRFEDALRQLAEAAATDTPIVTPTAPPPPLPTT